MKFAKYVYLIAGIYGIIALVPGFFMEAQFSLSSPPALTHPEFYYGFYGTALAWQFAFILISRDPLRYRPLMLVTLVEKAAFFLPTLVLGLTGRMEMSGLFLGGMIDGLLFILFALAYIRTGEKPG